MWREGHNTREQKKKKILETFFLKCGSNGCTIHKFNSKHSTTVFLLQLQSKKINSRSQGRMFHQLNTISTPWEAVMLMDHSQTGAPTPTYKPPKHPSSYTERYQVHTHKWKYAASTDLCTDPVTTCTPCNVNVSCVSCVTIYGWAPSVTAKIYFSRGATTVVEYLSGRQLQQPEFKDKMFHSNRLLLV